jgi:hypothetical protein
MSFKKRKDPNGGLTKKAKFERQLVLRKTTPKEGGVVQSIGNPISSVEDILRTYEHYRTTQQIDFPNGTKEQMIADYLLDSSDKQHLVFSCKRVTDGYEWYGQFVSDKRIINIARTQDVFQQLYN